MNTSFNNNDILDNTWIDEHMKFNDFYKEEIDNLNIFFIYIDSNKNITDVKKNKIFIDNPILTKEQIIYIITNHNKNTNKKYKFFKMFKFNFDIDNNDINKYLNNQDNFDFIQSYNSIEDININNTIHLFHSLNSVYFIFQERNKINFNKTTKNKTKLQTHKKHNTTRKLIAKI